MQRARLPLQITPLGELELMNALQLRLFRRELSPAEVKAAADLFRVDLQAGVFVLKSLSATIFDRAKKIARLRTASLGPRTLDVLHVASAVVLRADSLCTFDRHQRILAKAEGLGTPL